MCRIVLGIVFVLMAIDSIHAWYYQRAYKNEYTSGKVFIRVLAGLTQVPSDIPDEAREVNLRYNKITNISINAFSNLRDCKILRLQYNEISRIDPGMFNGLDSLTNLYLEYNMISAIAEGAFTNVSSLTHIYLFNNNIPTVPANVLPKNVKYLNAESNKISAIDFTNNVFLQTIHLHKNRISSLPANVFSTLSKCVYLSLYQNPVANIEVGAFNGLEKLIRLRLWRTSLTHLKQNMFQGLSSLQKLELDWARISDIPRGTFTGLDQLQSLHLGLNKLTVIETYTFAGLVSLKRLYLHENNINDIKDFAFRALKKLTHLYFFDNQLGYLSPNTFAGLERLECLDLGDNELMTLDPLVLSPFPRPLELALDTPGKPSSMVCDMKLCWLKLEKVGSIAWNFSRSNVLYITERKEGVYKPTCTGDVDWQSLQCPAIVPCRDPGEVDFAERSGSFLPVNDNSEPGQDLPYSTNTEFRYSCDPCYTGGGNITCQSSGQWTRKPECVRLDNDVVCRAPALVDGYLTPSFDQYECGVKVTFTCNQGSKQTVGACGPDGQFIGGISSCVKNESAARPAGQGTKPESGTAEGGSLIYGIVGGAVGGMVFMALIGLTIFCIKRFKRNNPSDADTAEAQNSPRGDEATEAGYTGLVTRDQNGKQGNNQYTQDDPVSDGGTPKQTVTGDEAVYNNLAYDDEYQEIKVNQKNITMNALPNDDPYADVDDDANEN